MPNFVGAHTNVYTGTLVDAGIVELREGCLSFRVSPAAGATATVEFGLSGDPDPLAATTGVEVVGQEAEFVSDPRTSGFGVIRITANLGEVFVSCDYRADASPERTVNSDPFAVKNDFTPDHDIGL